MRRSSHLAGSNGAYVEMLYEDYLDDPNSVPEEWRRNFDLLPMVDDAAVDVPHSTIVAHFERLGRNRLKAKPERVATEVSSSTR